jgi:tight adherence protein B
MSPIVFLGVTLAVALVFRTLAPLLSREGKQVSRRLNEGLRTEVGYADPAGLFKAPERLTLDAVALTGPAGGAGRLQLGERTRLDGLLEEARLPLTRQQFFAASAGLALGLGVVTGFLLSWLVAPIGLAVGFAALPLYVRFRCEARREMIARQLPNAFGLMARVIKSGHSVPQAMQAVADAFDGPLADEFVRCQKQQSLGIRPEVTFHEMALRTGILEVRIFVTAMLIQRQTGGNLSEILERLANLVRERLRLRKQVQTLTAEGRLQALTLLVLPFLVFGALWMINPKYAGVLLDHPSLIAATLTLMGLGVVWMKRILNFDM